MHYSGKRKRHTVKTPLMVNDQCVTIHKASHKKGRRHDYDIHKKSHPVTPEQIVSMFDPGYLGVGRDYPEQKSSMPNKKKRNTELSQEKDYNKAILKKDSDRAYYLQDKEMQDSCRHV